MHRMKTPQEGDFVEQAMIPILREVRRDEDDQELYDPRQRRDASAERIPARRMRIDELLRRERRVRQIVCCDAGADPHYRFDDLANLIRLARIDLRVEITVQTEFSGVLAGVFGAPRDFAPRTQPGRPAAPVSSDAGPVAAGSTMSPLEHAAPEAAGHV